MFTKETRIKLLYMAAGCLAGDAIIGAVIGNLFVMIGCGALAYFEYLMAEVSSKHEDEN